MEMVDKDEIKRKIEQATTWEKFSQAILTGSNKEWKMISDAVANKLITMETVKTIFDLRYQANIHGRVPPAPTGDKELDELQQKLFDVEAQNTAVQLTSIQIFRMLGALGGNGTRRLAEVTVLGVSPVTIYNKQEKIDALMQEYKQDPVATAQKYDGVYKFDEEGYPMKLNKFNSTWQRLAPIAVVRALFVEGNQFIVGKTGSPDIFAQVEPFAKYVVDISSQITTTPQGYKTVKVFQVISKKESLTPADAWSYIKYLPPDNLLNSVSELPRIIERAKTIRDPLASLVALDVKISEITKFQSGTYSATLFDADSSALSPDKIATGIFTRQDISKYGEGTELAIIGSVAENVQKAADGTLQKLPPKIFVWAAVPSPDVTRILTPTKDNLLNETEIANNLQDQKADAELGVDEDVEFPSDEELDGSQLFKP